MSRDPLGEYGGLNLYGFGPNSPVNGFDPTGRDWLDTVIGWWPGIDFDGDGNWSADPLPEFPEPKKPGSLQDDIDQQIANLEARAPKLLQVCSDGARVTVTVIDEIPFVSAVNGAVGKNSRGEDMGGIERVGRTAGPLFPWLGSIISKCSKWKCFRIFSKGDELVTQTLSKGDRIKMIVDDIGKINAKNADDALSQISKIVDRVEDAYSGAKKVKNPGKAYDGRMYGPRSDSITRHSDGSITAKINKCSLHISPDGKVTIGR